MDDLYYSPPITTREYSRRPTNSKAASGMKGDWENFTRVRSGFVIMNCESNLIKATDYDKGAYFGILQGTAIVPTFPIFIGLGIEGMYVTSEDPDLAAREHLLSFSVPLQLMGRIGNPEFSLEPFVGVHGKIHAFGRFSSTENDNYIDYFDKKDMGGEEYVLNRLQIGFQVGLGINLRAFYLGYEYRQDLSNIQDKSEVKCSHNMFTLGFNF